MTTTHRIVNPQEWPSPGNASDLRLLNLQIERQQLDLSIAGANLCPYGYLPVRHFNKRKPVPSPNQSLMISHLMTLMRLASKYDWEAVLSFHAAVLDRIESGLARGATMFSEIASVST